MYKKKTKILFWGNKTILFALHTFLYEKTRHFDSISKQRKVK
jgi:hypothetical protein